MDLYQAWAEEKVTSLTLLGDSVLFVDFVLFQRAMSNLLANALQHTPEGGCITITCQAS